MSQNEFKSWSKRLWKCRRRALGFFIDEDDCLLMSSINTVFPETSALKFGGEHCFCVVKSCEGKLFPPDSIWGKILYYCVFSKSKCSS